MKKVISILAILIAIALINPSVVDAQFRAEQNRPSISERIGMPYSPSNSSMVLGFIDPSKLDMKQSYSMSFISGAGQSTTLGMYTNRLSYMISPDMQIIADIGYLHQPFQSMNSGLPSNIFSNGQFFYGGELRYKPTDNTSLRIRLDNMPRYNSWGNPYSRSYSPLLGY
ncbi:MAG: hypothetical protein K9N46_10500 [Candidatus Marinimicrobia bacterium]|nr:hypothetical protein [Candidatus Neomarinimicrobiota bacterium]MCF7829191.1 hypothetical protein [Candidatus Neomarinimicrobiota bacterium]MCF7881156.1 hypothetical protein [Candidatus Neomarinimicrobiota bacterium]